MDEEMIYDGTCVSLEKDDDDGYLLIIGRTSIRIDQEDFDEIKEAFNQ